MLSEHPYLYCGHEPVNSVDPGGRWKLPEWAEKGWEWVKEHGRELWEWYEHVYDGWEWGKYSYDWYLWWIDYNAHLRMRDMYRDWVNRRGEDDRAKDIERRLVLPGLPFWNKLGELVKGAWERIYE